MITYAAGVGERPSKPRIVIWANVFLGLAILLVLVWSFVTGVIIGDLNQHLGGTEVVAVVVSEPFEGNCSVDSGCMWLAEYEIGLVDGPIIEEALADPNSRIGDAYTMTYSTEGVLTFGTMSDRAAELESFTAASRAIGVAAIAALGTWATLRFADKRSDNSRRTDDPAPFP